MARITAGVAVLVFGVVVAMAPRPVLAQKPADESAAFFKDNKVLHLDIVIEPRPLALLRAENRKYVRATIKEGKVEYPDVGIHLRGAAGSFRGLDDKAGFTINMNKFVVDKLFHGMDKWHLNNSVQDGSYISELICGEMMRDAGVPASRIQHAVVTFNGRKMGMYYLKEGYDKNFLKNHFKNADGNLYDGGFLRDIDQPLDLIRTSDDVANHADLKALAAACREPDVKARFAKMEKLLDMDRFISMFVVEAIVGDWDGYVSNRNNYRVYHDPKRDKIVFIPSGMDQEFGNAERGPIVPNLGGLVAVSLFQTPEGKARYYKRMAEVNTNILSSDKWVKRLDELQALLQPELAKIDAGAGADYPNQVKRIREFFRVRSKSIEQQLKNVK